MPESRLRKEEKDQEPDWGELSCISSSCATAQFNRVPAGVAKPDRNSGYGELAPPKTTAEM
jgi:hypothetical protein